MIVRLRILTAALVLLALAFVPGIGFSEDAGESAADSAPGEICQPDG